MTRRWISFALLLGLLGGCGGGSGGGGGSTGGGGGGAGAPPPPPPSDPYQEPPPTLTATFSSIQENIFTPICTSCHIGALAPEGLQLDSANSYGLLVDVPSVQVPSVLRVAPGDPDNSYLIQKLEGTAPMGRMPLDQPPLAPSTIAMIRQWIVDGALDDRASGMSAASKPIRATGSSIVPNSMIEALPETIMVMFDRDLDFSTVDLTTVSLSRSGGDGVFGNDSEMSIDVPQVGLSLLNPRALTVHLTGVPSVPDTYRLVLSGSPPSTIQDIAGNRLDGTWTQTFPSGDGTEGGDLHIEFTVVGSGE